MRRPLWWPCNHLFYKFFIDCDGNYEVTTAPVELLIGSYYFSPFGSNSPYRLAWSKQTSEPVNRYWAKVKPRSWPNVHGPVVLYRVYGTVDFIDVAKRMRFLSPRRFSLLKNDLAVKRWRKLLPQ